MANGVPAPTGTHLPVRPAVRLIHGRPSLLTVPQVAEEFQVTAQTIRNWIDQGVLPAIRVGRAFRIARRDVDALLDRAERRASRSRRNVTPGRRKRSGCRAPRKPGRNRSGMTTANPTRSRVRGLRPANAPTGVLSVRAHSAAIHGRERHPLAGTPLRQKQSRGYFLKMLNNPPRLSGIAKPGENCSIQAARTGDPQADLRICPVWDCFGGSKPLERSASSISPARIPAAAATSS